jgi:hypothetical protein
VLEGEKGVRRRSGQAAARGEDRGKKRGKVLRADDAVRGKRLGLLQERLRLKGVELVEVGAFVAHAVSLFQPRCADGD